MSGGRIEVRFFHAGSLAKGKEAVDAVLGGVADVGHMSYGYWPGRFPMTNALAFPGLFDTAIMGCYIAEKVINKPPLSSDWEGFKWLGTLASTSYPPFLIDKVTTAAELDGLRLRSFGRSVTATIEAVGAVAIPMGSGEIYESLSRGMLDGLPYILGSVPPYRFYEVVNYCIPNANFGTCPQGELMNLDYFNNLTPDLQAMVVKCGISRARTASNLYDVDAALAVTFLKANGVEFIPFSDAELAKFLETVGDAYAAWVVELEAEGIPAQATVDVIAEAMAEMAGKWDQ